MAADDEIEVITVEVPAPVQVIQLAVPGMQGPPGVFRIGTVTTGAEGTNASYSVTTDSDGQRQVLNLTIPRGDHGYGIPAGGITDQVVVKKSSTDYDVVWESASSSSQPNSLVRRDDNSAVEFSKVTVFDPPTAASDVARKDYVDAKFSDTGDVALTVVSYWTGLAFPENSYYRVKNGVVYFSVGVNRGTNAMWSAGQIVATLPVGARPTRTHWFMGDWSGVTNEIKVSSDGTIRLGTNVSASGIVASGSFVASV